MTVLNDAAVTPFDIVYAAVTEDIRSISDRLREDERRWLISLVAGFQLERSLWNTRDELDGYRRCWMRFRTPVMRLVAGAYLHIGYDLPRAMADDWPGRGDWWPRPDRTQAWKVYFGLRHVFPDNLKRAAGDRGVFGGMTRVTRSIPTGLLDAAGIWVENLRRGAWEHAEILAGLPDRRPTERAMAKAMEAALEDASLLHPWSVMNLRPVDGAFFNILPFPVLGAASPVATTTTPGMFWTGLAAYVGFLAGLMTALVVYWLLKLRSKARSARYNQADFIGVWGRLLAEYLDVAVRTPKDFSIYRRHRRIEMGLEPVDDRPTD